ncbi:virulence factor TspB C-terminal domain-related protein [Neisseria subflava]|uniref:virulence factor TspB C-terminal domain-related protein n=1 Tax=Neisseria subflava TaxID=28449 RepID=UPI000D30459A|nr:virulence factor TspB C-terminal domain-related protein [Neisseria subflava]
MKNDTRISIFIGYGKAHNISRLSVCLGSLLVVGQAWAEVGLPPPAQHQNAGFPSDQALQRRGYDPKTGVWKVDVQNNGKPTVTKNGGNINGSQGKTVTVTGRYGETGTMNTTVNQRVGTSAIQKTATGVWVGSSIANALNKNGSYVATQLRAGNYQSAFEGSVLALGDFGNNLFGGLPESIVNLGRSLGLVNNPSPQQFRDAAERFYAAQKQAEAEGNYQKAVANAAAKKAAEAAQKAKSQQEKKENFEKQEKSGKNVLLVRFREWGGGEGESVEWKSYVTSYGVGRSDYGNYNLYNFNSSISIKYSNDLTITYSPKFSGKYGRFLSISTYPNNELDRQNIINNNDSVDVNDFMLTQKEILDILKRMLENNQTNHAELMNQLAKMGVMNQSAEPSTFSPDTALSAPYTPEGSSTPQQTRFKMNQDGTVGVDYVPRPDLKPNSPEAPNKPEKTTPRRQESPDTPNTPNSPNSPNTPNESNSQNEQNQNDKEKDFCQQNPNAAQCMPSGDASYEDIKLPEQTIDLNFKPLDVFQSDGKCPAPRSVDFGALGQVEFSYDPLCDLARKLRPIFIAICVLTCAYFVYESVKEL